jgi:hypothetical protein
MTQMSFLTAKNLLYPKFNKEAILKTLVAPELEDLNKPYPKEYNVQGRTN